VHVPYVRNNLLQTTLPWHDVPAECYIDYQTQRLDVSIVQGMLGICLLLSSLSAPV